MSKSTLIFEGHITPAQFAPDGETELRMKQNEAVAWEFIIQREKFKVVRKGEFTTLEAILRDALVLAAAIVRTQALESSQPLDVEFTDWIHTDRDESPSPVLGDIRREIKGQRVDTKILVRCMDNARYVATVPALRWAVEDYNTALKLPNEAPLFCFRSVESLRSYFESDDDREQGWQLLRENLGIEREYLQYLTDKSIEIRHGARRGQVVPTSPDITAECIRRCKTVIEKFLEFLKRP